MAEESPAWLTAGTATTVVSNPQAQAAGKQIASNPQVQNAAKQAVISSFASPTISGASPTPPSTDPESGLPVEDPSASMDKDELSKMQKFSLASRICFIIISVLMGSAAYVALASSPTIETVFIAGYVIFFATVELNFGIGFNILAKIIADKFGFMYMPVGRSIYLFCV